MAAVLTTEAMGQDWMAKVANAVVECERMGIRVLPPDVNESMDTFTVVGGAIRF
jgi:DNA polymerase-3 subunit alpha